MTDMDSYRDAFDKAFKRGKHEEKAELRGGQRPPPPPSRCKRCGHYDKDHNLKGDKLCTHKDCICPGYRYDLSASLGMLGITAGMTGLLGSMMLGGMNKMFGMGSGDVEIKAKDVMFVMIDGFMGYYQEKEAEIKLLQEELEKVKDELERKKEHYDDAMATAQSNYDIAKQWQSKYMKLVSNSRKKSTTKKKK